MAELSVADFDAYFMTVHGAAPFPWQARLLREVARTGEWPNLLDLPTGTGKTAAIDVAVFHLALDAARPPLERVAPRRVVMVVDRRTVVDQAYERAKSIARALHEARDGVLRAVADRLRALAALGDDEAPLVTAELRGGMPRDDAWAHRPDQALVVVSTVDQVGSRLLFRGYGVSEAMRPIHAGLLGHDTLLLLDEVHLSRPFQETLAAVRRYRRWARDNLPERWGVVEMSATPGSARGFGLNKDDRRDARLSRRLRASKPVELTEPSKRGAFEQDCAERAAALAAPGRAVGVVVNRVAAAREILALLRRRLGERARLFLVTGRMRPLDRDELDDKLAPLVRSGRARAADAPPVIVVSTQCIEAGADFDFDALVTECASLDALRQRFGRLNRLGDTAGARAVVLVRAEALGRDPDPVYGEALARTWQWLREAPRDFGIEAMKLPEGEALLVLLAPSARAPVMLPAHLDLWAQTKPTPEPSPDVALWLHGIDRRQAPEVQIVWRADVSEELLDTAVENEDRLAALVARVEVCPPSGLEALSVPIYAARAWLAHEAAADVADVEGRALETDDDRREPRSPRRVLLWQGEDSRVVGPRDLRVGMTIVVPSTYGGLSEGTWDPASEARVPDRGDEARWKQTRRATLRLHPALLDKSWPTAPQPASEDADTDDRNAVGAWLQKLQEAPGIESWRAQALQALSARRGPAIVRLDDYLALVGRGRAADATTEDDGASYTGVEVTLDRHMRDVAAWAAGFGARCGLPDGVARDIALAARWHDAGKVDPRFQQMLHGGSAYRAAVAAEPLAKSTTPAADRRALARARRRSGYPDGERHELSSVALLSAHAPLLAEAHDRDLVLHLVASHHGWCRPFAPVTEESEPVTLALQVDGTTVRASSAHGLARLDAGIADRFFRLVERYGWFGLAWLEAILRLADHRRSEEEQKEAR